MGGNGIDLGGQAIQSQQVGSLDQRQLHVNFHHAKSRCRKSSLIVDHGKIANLCFTKVLATFWDVCNDAGLCLCPEVDLAIFIAHQNCAAILAGFDCCQP